MFSLVYLSTVLDILSLNNKISILIFKNHQKQRKQKLNREYKLKDQSRQKYDSNIKTNFMFLSQPHYDGMQTLLMLKWLKLLD